MCDGATLRLGSVLRQPCTEVLQLSIPSFLTSFLFLLSFFRSSTVMASMPRDLASSQCLWSPKTHTCSSLHPASGHKLTMIMLQQQQHRIRFELDHKLPRHLSESMLSLSKHSHDECINYSDSGGRRSVLPVHILHGIIYLHARSGRVGKLDSSTEALVFLRVIVLESNLYRKKCIAVSIC